MKFNREKIISIKLYCEEKLQGIMHGKLQLGYEPIILAFPNWWARNKVLYSSFTPATEKEQSRASCMSSMR